MAPRARGTPHPGRGRQANCIQAAVGKPTGDALVCQQHGLLDKGGRPRALARHDALRQTRLVKQGVDLDRLEIDRPAPPPDFAPGLRQGVGVAQKRWKVHAASYRLLARCTGALGIVRARIVDALREQDIDRIVIGAHTRVNDTRIGRMAAHPPAAVELDIHGECQAVHTGLK